MHPITGDCRDEDAAAERNHLERMRAIYLRLEAIEQEKHALVLEATELRKEICAALGVSVGDIVSRGNGRQSQITSMEGDFEAAPSGAASLFAVVRCRAAPETKAGFHSIDRHNYTIWDETSFPVGDQSS